MFDVIYKFHEELILLILFLLIIILVIAKIIFLEKFKKKYFLILLSIFSTLFIGLITTIVISQIKEESSRYIQIEQTIQQHLTETLSYYSFILYDLALSLVVIAIVTSIISIIIYFKNKKKNIFKRLLISYAILGIIFYFSMPSLVAFHNKKIDTYITSIEKNKKAYSLTKSRILNYGFSVGIALSSFYLLLENSRGKDENYYSTEEAQVLINDYIKYGENIANYGGYSFYIEMASVLINLKQYEKAEKYIKLSEEKGANLIEHKVALYIAKGEYNKALEIINKADKETTLYYPDNLYMHLLQIYYGLNNYEKMLTLLESAKKRNYITEYKYYSLKSLVYNKMCNEELALENYNKIKMKKKSSFEETLLKNEYFLLKHSYLPPV